jgi:hypothetical protein
VKNHDMTIFRHSENLIYFRLAAPTDAAETTEWPIKFPVEGLEKEAKC